MLQSLIAFVGFNSHSAKLWEANFLFMPKVCYRVEHSLRHAKLFAGVWALYDFAMLILDPHLWMAHYAPRYGNDLAFCVGSINMARHSGDWTGNWQLRLSCSHWLRCRSRSGLQRSRKY